MQSKSADQETQVPSPCKPKTYMTNRNITASPTTQSVATATRRDAPAINNERTRPLMVSGGATMASIAHLLDVRRVCRPHIPPTRTARPPDAETSCVLPPTQLASLHCLHPGVAARILQLATPLPSCQVLRA